MAGPDQPPLRGKLQTLPPVAPPARPAVPLPRQVSTPGAPARQTTGSPPAPSASTPTASTASAGATAPPAPPGQGFYQRMFSGEIELPVAPPPKAAPRWPRVAAAMGIALGVAATGVVINQIATPSVVVESPLPLTLDEERALADLWLTFGAPGPVRNDAVARTVAAIGDAVAGPMKPRLGGRIPRFRVVDHAAPRTVALPDGTVTISTGLLRRLQSDAELAAVLAHSLAHVAAGHVVVTAASDEEALAIHGALKGGLNRGSPVRAIDALRDAAQNVGTPEREQAADALMVEGLRAAKRSSLAAAEGLVRLQTGPQAPGDWEAVHVLDPVRLQKLHAIPPFGTVDERGYQQQILALLTPGSGMPVRQ